MRRLDMLVALVLLLASGIMLAGTRELGFWNDFSPGDRFMPVLVAVTLGLLSLALLVTAWRGAGAGETVAWPDSGASRRVAAFAASIVAFAVAAAWLGFVTASFGFVFLTLVLILRKPIVTCLLAATLTTGLVQGIFISWLGLRLPTGPMGF
jgi:hypothetical protein